MSTVSDEGMLEILFSQNDEKLNWRKIAVDFIIPASYVDDPRNLKPFKVCLNAILVIFDYGYDKISSLRTDINNAGV